MGHENDPILLGRPVRGSTPSPGVKVARKPKSLRGQKIRGSQKKTPPDSSKSQKNKTGLKQPAKKHSRSDRGIFFFVSKYRYEGGGADTLYEVKIGSAGVNRV